MHVQGWQWKLWSAVWHVFWLHNKDTRATPMSSFWYLYCQCWACFAFCSTVSVVDFKQVYAGWVLVILMTGFLLTNNIFDWFIYFVAIFRWGTHLYVSLFLSVHPSISLSVCLSVHHALYLRKRASSNQFLVHICKMISQGFFSFFWNLIFWAVSGVKGQNIAQNENNYMCHVPSQEQYSIWSWFLVHLGKMMISPGIYFIFSGC